MDVVIATTISAPSVHRVMPRSDLVRTRLHMMRGQMYFFSARACNFGRLWSHGGVSNPVRDLRVLLDFVRR